MDRWLLLDIGNSETLAGVSDGESILSRFRFRTNPDVTADEYRSHLSTLLKYGRGAETRLGLEGIRRAVVSSVVPAVDRIVRAALNDLSLLIVDHRARRDFELDLPFPEQLGADRLANAAGALATVAPPCIIVDAGTATTVCLIDERPAYIGGAISPGLLTSWRSLVERAAKLTSVPLELPPRPMGVTTETQLQSGLLIGHASLITGLVEAMRRDAGGGFTRARVLATGGCAPLMRLPEDYLLDADLTLRGLLRYGQLNPG